jgi:hypothetical protein
MEPRASLDKAFRHLKAGSVYQVVKDFRDYDKEPHTAGETWIFIGSNFVPYDDGLSLFASIDGVDQQIRLQWRPEEQAEIIDNLEAYLVPHA